MHVPNEKEIMLLVTDHEYAEAMKVLEEWEADERMLHDQDLYECILSQFDSDEQVITAYDILMLADTDVQRLLDELLVECFSSSGE